MLEDVRLWVPRNCRLYVTFDPAEGWMGSLRLRHDYLGYLVTTTAGADAEAAIAAVRAAYQAGFEDPGSLDVARASYFRQVVPPVHQGPIPPDRCRVDGVLCTFPEAHRRLDAGATDVECEHDDCPRDCPNWTDPAKRGKDRPPVPSKARRES